MQEIEERLAEIEILADLATPLLDNAETRVAGNAITRSAVVLLCGYFEGGVRDLAEEFVDIINDNEICVSKLPQSMLCILAEEATESFHQNKDKLAKLSESIKGDNHIRFDKKRNIKTNANPSVVNLDTIFSTIGLNEVIEKLSKEHYDIDSTYTRESQITEPLRLKLSEIISARGLDAETIIPELSSAIETKWAPKKKRRKVGYVSEIEQLLKIRNRIAHGEGFEFVTPQELKHHKVTICKLLNGLNTMLDSAILELV